MAYNLPLKWETMFHNHIAQTGNIIVLYTSIVIFKFLERSLEDNSVWTEQ